MSDSTDMTAKEILNDFKENYDKVRKLLDEHAKNDPVNEPYLSKYKAKEILLNMRENLKNVSSETSLDQIKLDAMLGTILLNIGIIDSETEELTPSEKVLSEAAEILAQNASKPEIVITLINVYNNLGILWSNRGEQVKAKTYLIKAKELYENFKCTLQLPLPIETLVSNIGETDVGDFMFLEKAHTLTLYYLAQVYNSLKENLKSAVYYHVTLRRQFQYSDYEPIDWALNSATLSQVFAEHNGFYQSRHHLAAASVILEQYEDQLRAEETTDDAYLAKLETFNHRSADVARCWVKYCILLMNASKARLMNDEELVSDMANLTLEENESISGVNIKDLVYPDLDVSKYESNITDKYLLTYQDARQVFLACQNWLNKAKEYYTLESLASDYIELIQDSSEAYNRLAFFEEDDVRRAKMIKRRIDMLQNLIQKINPTYYLQYCRQIWFELALAYSDILNIKWEFMQNESESGKITPHLLTKINMLSEKAIQNYDNFLNSIKNKEGNLPAKLSHDLIKPVINAYAFIGRNSMKRVSVEKAVQLEHVLKSYEAYKAVVDICNNDKDAAAMMKEEFALCQEMVNMLQIKINKLQSDLAS